MNYIKNGNWVRYQNGNYFVSINLDNGTKIRETINPDATEFVADFPESADVKSTNRCTNPLGYTNLTDKEIKFLFKTLFPSSLYFTKLKLLLIKDISLCRIFSVGISIIAVLLLSILFSMILKKYYIY